MQPNNAHKNYGKLPKYLTKYNDEAADLERKRAELKNAKKLPEGMRQVPEEERLETLDDLKGAKDEI